MSTETEHVEDGSESTLLESWREWYHLPVIVAVMLFMFLTRMRAFDEFSYEDGSPELAAVDSWYHWRMIEWTAEHYPYTMPFEVWTSFPDGRYVGQFGTLFDQIIVTVAMIVGLGDPSTQTLFTVALITVPAMAALVAIPVFLIGRRLGGTFGGIIGVGILALAPGQFLQRTTVGQLQHHVAEVLFMGLAVLAMMVALRVAEREQPIWELLLDKDWDTLRKPALYSALAGIALTLYIWVWPPGIVLIGIFGIFFTVQLCIDYARGISPDHTAFVGAVSLGLAAIGTALLIEEPGTSATSFGYLQPISSALVAAGCVFMAWLARQWNARGLERRYYPAAIGGLLLLTFAIMAVVLPDFLDTLVSNVEQRVLPIGEQETDATIAEASRPPDYAEHFFQEFGMAFYTMLAGLAFLIARPFFGREFRAEYTLIVVWSLFLISMSMTQIRFAYYLVLAVAVLNAVFIADLARVFNLNLAGTTQSLRQLETYQILTLVMVVLLLFAPLLPPMASDTGTAWDRGEATGPSQDSILWEESNQWLSENTPEPGDWGGADNSSELEYMGVYDYPEGGEYAYPEGAYGVLSWWDYGHLTTVQGERIPHSNPFQSGASSSAAFLTAESEERGEAVLDGIAVGESVADVPTDEIRQNVDEADETHEDIRYVMVDYQSVSTNNNFGAVTQWAGPDGEHYITPEDYEQGDPIEADELENLTEDIPYYDTMISQLFHGDAAGMENYRLVHENDAIGNVYMASYAQVQDDQVALDEEGNPAIAVGQQVSRDELAQIDQSPDIELFDAYAGAPVKTFERVEGATITGNVDDDELAGDDSAMITATAELETDGERTVGYAQEADIDENGEYELTVPYATNDELGVEDGYTDSSVEALDDYNLTVTTDEDGLEFVDQYEGQVEVPETAVVEGEEIDDIDLEAIEDGEEGDPEDDVDDEADEGDVDDEDDGETDDTEADTEDDADEE